MSAPVEIEFAVRLAAAPGAPSEFGFLQMRPLALSRESEALETGRGAARRAALPQRPGARATARSPAIRDLVVVDFQRFERARSREAAAEVGRLNARLSRTGRPYLLVGVGRWGSRDPWLGIPVTWDQISGARVIVEAGSATSG